MEEEEKENRQQEKRRDNIPDTMTDSSSLQKINQRHVHKIRDWKAKEEIDSCPELYDIVDGFLQDILDNEVDSNQKGTECQHLSGEIIDFTGR